MTLPLLKVASQFFCRISLDWGLSDVSRLDLDYVSFAEKPKLILILYPVKWVIFHLHDVHFYHLI